MWLGSKFMDNESPSARLAAANEDNYAENCRFGEIRRAKNMKYGAGIIHVRLGLWTAGGLRDDGKTNRHECKQPGKGRLF